MAELTPKAFVAGVLRHRLRRTARSSLALKAAGPSPSSIPIAVIAISLGRMLLKTTILENKRQSQDGGLAASRSRPAWSSPCRAFLFLSSATQEPSTRAGYFDTYPLPPLVVGGSSAPHDDPAAASLIVKEHGCPVPRGHGLRSVLIRGRQGGRLRQGCFRRRRRLRLQRFLRRCFHVVAETACLRDAQANKWLLATGNARYPEYLGWATIMAAHRRVWCGGLLSGSIPLLSVLVRPPPSRAARELGS